jgi:type I restriction enzyme R subunit
VSFPRPKTRLKQRFGVKQENGTFKPFHLYSMKQAIEEGFILDVLANYTTYKSYYEIEKSIQACNCERHLIEGNEKVIERITQLNVDNSIAEILEQSEYLKNKATSGEIKIVSGIYDTQTGAVLFN